MPSELGRAEVERIAALAHLALTDAELEIFERQLADILAYARQIREVDTAGVPPTSHALSSSAMLRPDRVTPSLSRADALGNAPDAAPDAGLFSVPRVIGG
jgi:aspartyl-tRNA(Asn)/glutamyl-tRNA(Gln) amidotransferase subunit C